MFATKRALEPGELVVEFSSKNNGPARAHFAIIVAVGYPREGHMGCEEYITVLWVDPPYIDTTCDCHIISASDV